MKRRGFLQLLGLAPLVAIATLTGCASSILLEGEHISHPSDGWPCEPQKWSEDDVTQASVLLHWRKGNAYADAGLGVNLQGNNGGGFQGNKVTGTVRIGYEIPLR